jgi:hypothetical protein
LGGMCGSIWRPGMAAAKLNWPDFSVFLTGLVNPLTNSAKIPVIKYLFGQWPSRSANCSFYILLCMFNGFAFDRPFCQAIKVSLTGVEF